LTIVTPVPPGLEAEASNVMVMLTRRGAGGDTVNAGCGGVAAKIGSAIRIGISITTVMESTNLRITCVVSPVKVNPMEKIYVFWNILL
jgi:hypothetical protein